jgi:hypothetical protein
MTDRRGYLAGTDEQRAADLNAMIRDPEVRGFFAIRGGWDHPAAHARRDLSEPPRFATARRSG